MSSFVQPFSPRYTIKDSETSLEITTKIITRLQRCLQIAAAIFGSIIWMGVGVGIANILKQEATFAFHFNPAIYILPVEWLLGSAVLFVVFLWSFTNKEIIQISEQNIVVSLKSRIFNRTRCYLAKDIKDLRVSSYAGKSIAFDYGARTVRFGLGLDEAEAKQILAAIQKKFPVYSL